MVLLIAALTGCGSEASVRKEDKMMLPENAKAMENAVGQGFTPQEGSHIDKKGNIVDKEGNTFNKEGKWQIPEGGRVDSKGRIIDKNGRVMGGGATVGSVG